MGRSTDSLHLLGGGHDAIFVGVGQPSDERRLHRYIHARNCLLPVRKSALDMLALRIQLGTHYRTAWRAGRRPRLDLCTTGGRQP